jgi:tripartite-type tricarboxylate transporter receptor subunit TctC
MRRKFAILAVTMAVAASAGASRAQTVAEFYIGKDIRVLIGGDVGGTYGLYAQLASRHMRKHIPGQPNLALQTMPGAGGITALNHSYNVAPKDGTLMHLLHAEVLFETLLTKGVRFKARDYTSGSVASPTRILLA